MPDTIEPPDSGGDLYLGTLLGRRQAFSAIAARCTAADAAALREIRDHKAYRSLSQTFDEFCPKHLGISERHANRLIRYLNEFGPEYFTLAQLTGISPVEYRAIAPAVKDQTLHHNGQAIALLPENGEQLAVALAELRASAPKPAPSESLVDDQFRRVERLVEELTAAIRALSRMAPRGPERAQLAALLAATCVSAERMEFEFDPPK